MRGHTPAVEGEGASEGEDYSYNGYSSATWFTWQTCLRVESGPSNEQLPMIDAGGMQEGGRRTDDINTPLRAGPRAICAIERGVLI